MWRKKVDLVIEIGTMCGGSAIFYAKTMMDYNPAARVVTFDVRNEGDRMNLCKSFSSKRHDAPGGESLALPGLKHPFWRNLTTSGNIIPLMGPASHHLARLDELSASSKTVMVIDDGDHVTRAVLETWEVLHKYTSVGSYYLVQDTRLDTDCAYAILTSRAHWCSGEWKNAFTDGEGGPGLAIDKLVQRKEFKQGWVQDRSIEAWGVTQHPGGYLLRRA